MVSSIKMLVAAATLAVPGAATAQEQRANALSDSPYSVAALGDEELGKITGMAPAPRSSLRTMADSFSATNSYQLTVVSRVILDNWLVDVAAPLIANNQLLGR